MSATTSSYWCYRCSSFVTVSPAGSDSPVVCPDCGQQRWSSAVVESTPTIEVNDQRPAAESLHTIEVCAVCIEALTLGDEVRETPCKHTYHSNCIRQWLTHHSSCPMCRHQLLRDSPAVGRERPVEMEGGRRRGRGVVRRFVRGLLSCFNCIIYSMGAVAWYDV